MDKYLKDYLNSFQPKKEHGYTLLLDFLFIGIIGSLFVFFGSLVKKKAELLAIGKTPEQIQQALLTMGPEKLAAFLGELKSFLVVFLIGLVVLIALGWLGFSLSRALVWNKLVGRELSSRNYWKWNLLNLTLIIPLVGYLVGYGIVKLVLNFVFSSLSSQLVFLEIVNNLVNLFFLLLFLVFGFLVYYSFTEKYKVWESIGKAFERFKIKGVWWGLVLAWGTAIVLTLILWPLGKQLGYQPNVLLGINIVISLLFLNWMRVYVVGIIKE